MSTSRRRVLVIAGVIVMITALSACSKKDAGASAIGSVGVTPNPSPSDSGTGGPGGGATGTATTTATGTATATVTQSPTRTQGGQPTVTVTVQPKITIDVFRVTADGGPACPVSAQPGASFSSPGHDITLEWRVSGNVDHVALSIDDPTFYKNNNGLGTWKSDYDRSGQETLPWNCDPDHTANHFTTHTYTLSTIGGGPSVAKTITIKTSNDNS